MSLAYFDCFAGAAGDMIVASLLDAGASLPALEAELAKLGLEGYQLRAQHVRRGGIGGLRLHVEITSGASHDAHHDSQASNAPGTDAHAAGPAAHAPHRGLRDILAMIERAGLAPRAAERAAKVFTRLAQAEAKVHRTDVQNVHFHEVGAVDSIVDIVGACLALEQLGVDRVICSAIPVGRGTVTCAHGVLPLPAPATAELLAGAAIVHSGIEAEVTTPTAAALLTTLAESQGPPPPMRVAAVGYGAGTRTEGPLPNLLRVFIGQADSAEGNADSLVELSANIDDCTGEIIGAAIERLLSAGCVDAWAGPIVMKKSRPAWTLSALCAPGDVEAVERILFAQTTTFGIRRHAVARSKLLRRSVTVETPYGPIRVKEGCLDGQVVSASPEFADCQSAAETHHVPVKEVFGAAQACWRKERRP